MSVCVSVSWLVSFIVTSMGLWCMCVWIVHTTLLRSEAYGGGGLYVSVGELHSNWCVTVVCLCVG